MLNVARLGVSLGSFCGALVVALAAAMGTANAFEPKGSDKGTMHLAPDEQWAKTLPEKDLGKYRGGFRGIAFTAAITAFIENSSGNLNGNVTVNGNDVNVPGSVGDGTGTLPDGTHINSSNGQAQITSFVGSLSSIHGIVNIVQVPGNNNTVSLNVNVNAAIINVYSNNVTINSSFVSSVFGN